MLSGIQYYITYYNKYILYTHVVLLPTCSSRDPVNAQKMTLSSLQGKEQGVVNPIASPYDGGDIPDDELEGIEKNMFDD